MAINNKKGYFFTLSVVLMLVIIGLVMNTRSNPGYSDRSEIESQRLLEIDRFVHSVENDAKIALRTSGLRTFVAIDNNITKKEGYITANFSGIFEEIMINGKYQGNNLDIMVNSTLTHWNESIKRTANSLGFEAYFQRMNVSAWQEDPWHVTLELSARFIVRDSALNSFWEQEILVQDKVPIEFLLDPVYTVGTGNRYFQRFIKTDLNDTFPASLFQHIEDHKYIATEEAPGYLQRLQGDFSPPFIHGVESLVDMQTMADYGLVKDLPIRDWEYFNDETSSDICELVPSWVKIDKDIAKHEYNVNPNDCVGFTPPANPCNFDGVCDRPIETNLNCPADCLGARCGNGNCESPQEDSQNCPQDCTVIVIGPGGGALPGGGR